MGGDDGDALGLGCEREALFVAAGVVLADGGELLVLVADENRLPEIPCRIRLYFRRPQQERLQPSVLEHDVDGAPERRIRSRRHIQGQNAPAISGMSNMLRKTLTPSTMELRSL